MTEICPCDTGKNYNDCCGPLITGSLIAKKPVDLMRARYTAYANCEVEFIMDTIAPSKKGDYDKKSIKSWSKSTDWKELEIVSTTGGEENETTGTVEFKAFYREKDATKKHHELATIIKKEDKWYFEDGKQGEVKQVKRDEPKVGRNDPCPCGSGKKYKKCHAL